MTTKSESREVRTRRRGAALEEEIFRAAWAELEESGWSAFRIDKVAERAGTGKQPIYRRWPNRVALAIATFQHMAQHGQGPIAPTDDLRHDLLAILERISTTLAGPVGQVARGVLAELGQAAPEAGDMGGIDRQPASFMLDVFEHARAIGAVDAARLGPVLMNVGPDLATHHFLRTGAPPTETDRELIVDQVWLPLLTVPG